ncbi:MAG: family 43 glycosylhydrolase [Lachnospiraceae bacterium]|nr:family 43 glycosylhydrolase [Lachnospiraceae bacterium]
MKDRFEKIVKTKKHGEALLKKDIKKGNLVAGAIVHDPMIFSEKKGKYYLFGTHYTSAVSNDLKTWKQLSGEFAGREKLFSDLFDDDCDHFRYCKGFNQRFYDVWAPDVSYNPYLKKYVMYLCSSGSYIKSSISMATSDKPEGPYKFEERLLDSGFTKNTVKETNIKRIMGKKYDPSKYIKKNGNYNNLAYPNCIDPNTFHDEEGRFWMVYGSWSGGIYLLEIDEKTGRLIHPKENKKEHVDPYFGRRLIGGGHKSIEGPYILYDRESGYYYLFVSFGWLARDGGYQIRLFRAKSPKGPYTDMNGKTFGRVPDHSKYGLKMMGNYNLPSLSIGYKAPGHNSAFIDKDGAMYVVYHQRFDDDTERHEPRAHRLSRTKDGWLVPSAFAKSDDEVVISSTNDKFSLKEAPKGTYNLVCHGSDISKEVHDSKAVTIEDGYIKELNMRIPEDSSAIFKQTDEAGNATICISWVSDNLSYWAVKYV